MSGEAETVAAARIAPEFRVYDVTWVPDAVAPTLSFALGVTETSGREVFTIALTAQINIDPALRRARALGGDHQELRVVAGQHARAELHGRDDLHAAHAVHL